MSEQRTSLSLPLYRRDWTRWLSLLACGATGWLYHRPVNWPDAIVSVLVGGAAVWFVFGSSLSFRLYRQTPRWISIGWRVVSLVGLVWMMSRGMPFLYTLVQSMHEPNTYEAP